MLAALRALRQHTASPWQALVQAAFSRQLCTSSVRQEQAGTGAVVEKLLVANRGEIACRVLQTARKLGIPSVAVYSEADRNALHVQYADEAFCIGPAAARESYLRQDRIIQVAKQTGVTAIHPGYGFLSENAAFAQLCKQSDVTFVGPPAPAITAMGDKSEAKALMAAAGVPVVPGYHGEDQSPATLEREAARCGFPLLVKATRGGGGKGMKLAASADQLEEAVASAKREAAASFGDDRVLLERFIQRPRHVEVQVFADSHGNAVYLFERDCSVQRRHQKVIEEAPAPHVTEGFRASIGQAAVAAARAVGYVNAGTVEFIVDTDTGDYYFMEMNTRLQVEHPVTEMVTGLDLVDWQLRIAAGHPLPLAQDQLRLHGHAFEARLYAEAPERDFMPAPGTVRRWAVPPSAAFFTHEAGDVRVDSGVQQGDQVGVNYDPMIAKVIAHGLDRAEALANLRTALAELQVSGLPTNLAFLRAIAAHPAFAAGHLDTSFIPKHLPELLAVPPLPPAVAALAGVAAHLHAVHEAQHHVAPALGGAWAQYDSFRLSAPLTRSLLLQHPASKGQLQLDLTLLRGGAMRVRGSTPQGEAVDLTVSGARLEGDRVSAQVGDQLMVADFESHLHHEDQVLSLWVGGEAYECRQHVPRAWKRSGAAAASAGVVITPMPGKITRVLAAEGDSVEEGQALATLEAMKMEHTVRAPCTGTLTTLNCLVGAQVDDGSTLAVVEPAAAAAAA